MVDIWQ